MHSETRVLTKCYPKTGKKSLEEIEKLFADGGPRPWKTKLGHSEVDERAEMVKAEQRKASLEQEEKTQRVRQDGTIETVDKA